MDEFDELEQAAMPTARRPAGSRAPRPSLQRFLATLDRRLAEMTARDIRATIRSHAQSLPSDQRRAFLDIFTQTPPSEDGPEVSWPVEDDPLLDEIDELVERIAGGSYFEDFGWDDDIHEQRSLGDDSWIWEMDGLFDDAQAAFLAGDPGLARAAYERLLRAFELDQDVGTFCGSSPALEAVTTDVAEAEARLLRAVYETTPPAERASVLAAEWFELPSYPGPTLAAVREARPQDLPGLDAFLPEWITELTSIGAGQPGIESSVRPLLAEAVELHGGADGLAALARQPGPGSADRFLYWVEALRRSGRHMDAVAAAHEALAAAPPHGDTYARIAELLAELLAEVAAGDAQAALAARRAAWRALPTDGRLLALHGAAPTGQVSQMLDDEVAALADAPTPVTGRLRALLLLLAGRTGEATALLGSDECTQAPASRVVLPYLLATGCGGPSHPRWETSQVARLLRSVDTPWWSDWTRPLATGHETPRAQPLSDLLIERLATDDADLRQRQRWLRLARDEIDRRVRAIVTGKARRRYGEAARLAACCVEALTLADDQAAGTALVAALRRNFSRHSAFQRELETAVSKSVAEEVR